MAPSRAWAVLAACVLLCGPLRGPQGVVAAGASQQEGVLETEAAHEAESVPRLSLDQWPAFMFGASVRQPWLLPFTAKSIEVSNSCRAFGPAEGATPDAHPMPCSLGRSLDDAEQEWLGHGSLRGPEHQRSPKLRALIWLPKHGLGNTLLLGFPHALAFAVLAKRRLLRVSWGLHKLVLDTLCEAFDCGVDSGAGIGDPRLFAKRLPAIEGEAWPQVLGDPTPWWLWEVYLPPGKQWWKNAGLWQCIKDTFQCDSLWCFYSKALQVIMQRPSLALAQAIAQSFDVALADTRQAGASESPGTEGQLGAARAGARRRGLSLSELRDDHVGGAVLGETVEGAARRALLDGAARGEPVGGAPGGTLVGGAAGGEPVEGAAGGESAAGVGRQGATRVPDPTFGTHASPTLLGALQKGGSTHASPAGVGVRAEQEGGSAASLAGPAGEGEGSAHRRSLLGDSRDDKEPERGLHLHFDLAIHVRTYSRCVEGDPYKQGCHSTGLADSLQKAYSSAEFGRWITTWEWACVSNVAAQAQKLKQMRQKEEKEEVLPLPRDAAERDALVASLEGFSPNNISDRFPLREPWTIKKAQEFARQSGSTPRAPPLSIFLGVDSEILRPLLVEFLRPFGNVVFSRGIPGHTSFLGRSDGGDKGMAAQSRLLSLAEFYLMSKASLIFSTNPQKSSFSNAAAVYGNATYIHRGHFSWEKEKCRNSCCLFVDHWGTTK